MEEKVFRYIRTQALLEAGDDVTVALSGGADSVALLWVLKTLAPRLGLTLRAAHFHHGIRGAEADRDEAFCRALCQSWEVPFLSGRGDAPARAAATGESLEEAARVLRYAWLRSAAPGKLATAHNADDNAETVLLNLLRGAGPRGLGGIPPRRENVVRPLLSCTRAQIEDLLRREGLPHVEDSTNASDDCLRNRLRHRIMPLLREENPNLTETLGRTAALIRAEDDCLSGLARAAAENCRAGEGWSCKALLALESALRRRVLLGLLRQRLEDPSAVYVAGLEALLSAGPSARMDLPGGLQARRVYDELRIGPTRSPLSLPETRLSVPGRTELPGGLGAVTCAVTKNLKIFPKLHTIFALKYDRIGACEIAVRGRRPADRLRLCGGSKSLKALMIDRKIPAYLRGALPVLTADGQILAVFGVGADPALLAAPGEQALVFEYESGLPDAPDPAGEASLPSPDTERKN